MVHMPHWPVGNWHKSQHHNLNHLLKLSEKLGNPHLRTPPIIHVAGTNGKGSSVAILKAIFEAANYKVHAYTSPHLLQFNERIILAGEKISDDYLYNVLERTRIAAQNINSEPQSFFEGITIAAFLAFSEVKADILILETGIGGRLDATNIISSPLISLITQISYDHMDYLGPTLPMIAYEKAGIIKEFSPCIISAQRSDEIYEIFLSKCQELSAAAFCYEYDYIIAKSLEGFTYTSKSFAQDFPCPSLVGDHQLINAAACIAVITLINNHFRITKNQIFDGLQKAKWPARIQKVPLEKYANLISPDINIWVDGAHNEAGAYALAAWIKDNIKGPVFMIIGMTKKRNVSEFCLHFKDLATYFYGVKVMCEADSYSADNIHKEALMGGINMRIIDSIEEGLIEINNISKNANIIICGSLYLASDLFKLLNICF